MTFTEELSMPRHRLHVLAALLLTLTIGQASAQQRAQQAQAPPQAQGAQQGPQGGPQGQAAPQPIYIVPAPQTLAPLPAPSVVSELPMVELAPLLQRVERAADKRFLVDGKVGPRIYLAGAEPNDVTYPVLLSILRANGLAAVEIEGRVNIVRDAEVRFLGAPMTQTDDPSIAADEWVTRVLKTTNTEAVYLVPILRPLLPQAAHLAAHATTNQLIIMDRYANVQRITAIVRALDVPSPQQ
jgi:general secretion pathway protein D